MCGFNAFKSADLLHGSDYGTKGGRAGGTGKALGTIALSGEVTEYEWGYRGQKARLVGQLHVYGRPYSQDLLDNLAFDYDIEVVSNFNNHAPVAQWLGQDAKYMRLHEQAPMLIERLSDGAHNLAVAEDVVDKSWGLRPPSIIAQDADSDLLIAALLHCVHVLQLPGQWVEPLLNQGLGLETPYTLEQLKESVPLPLAPVMRSSLSVIEKAMRRSKLVRKAAQAIDLWALDRVADNEV